MISMAEITDACDLFTDDTSPTRRSPISSHRTRPAPKRSSPKPCWRGRRDAVAADAESLSFEGAPASGAGAFFDALQTGLLAELPALCADAPPRDVPRFPPGGRSRRRSRAMSASCSPPTSWLASCPPASRARWRLHIPAVYAVGRTRRRPRADVVPPPARWRHGVLHCIDRALGPSRPSWAAGPSRWRKRVPAPELKLLGGVPERARAPRAARRPPSAAPSSPTRCAATCASSRATTCASPSSRSSTSTRSPKRSAAYEEQASCSVPLAFSLCNVQPLVRLRRSARHALRPQEFLHTISAAESSGASLTRLGRSPSDKCRRRRRWRSDVQRDATSPSPPTRARSPTASPA